MGTPCLACYYCCSDSSRNSNYNDNRNIEQWQKQCFTDEQLREMLGSSLSNDLGIGTATTAGTGFLDSLLGGVGNFLGGTGGQLLGAGVSIDALNDIARRGKDFQSEALALGERAQQDTAFKPFSIRHGLWWCSRWSTRGLHYYSISRATGFTSPVSRHYRRFNRWFWCWRS